MSDFLRRLAELARPYKLRLGLGVICGILSGFLEPLLIVTVVFVWNIVFQPSQATAAGIGLPKIPVYAQELINRLQSWISAGGAPSSKAMLALVISAIPLVM